jgi:hypothetical protein
VKFSSSVFADALTFPSLVRATITGPSTFLKMNKVKEVLLHPDELYPLLQMVVAAKKAQSLPKEPSLAFCYDMLNKVSRR